MAGERTEWLEGWPEDPVRLSDGLVEQALAGEESIGWSQDLESAVVWNTVAVPIRLENEVYGAIVMQSTSDGLLLVTPRVGTLSPWSSKATDIARRCGLRGVERIERGIAFRLSGIEVTAEVLDAAIPALHDRMTQSVLSTLEETRALFAHAEPRALQHVAALAHGKAALEQADRDLGLALSADEIDYLLASFQAMGRDPTDAELMMFAQANSEHCRHKIFNAEWVIDGQARSETLFGMISSSSRQVRTTVVRIPISITFTTIPSTSSISPGLIVRSTRSMTPETKF